MKRIFTLTLILLSFTTYSQDFNIKEIGRVYDLKKVSPHYYSYMSEIDDYETFVLKRKKEDKETSSYKLGTVRLRNGKVYKKYLKYSNSNVRVKQSKKSKKYNEIPNKQISTLKFEDEVDSLIFFNFKEKEIKSVLSNSDYLKYAYENDSLIIYKRKYTSQNGPSMLNNGMMVSGGSTSYSISLAVDKTTGEYYYFESDNYVGLSTSRRDERSKDDLEKLLSKYSDLKKLIPSKSGVSKPCVNSLIDLLNVKLSGGKLYLNRNWDVVNKDTTNYSYTLNIVEKSSLGFSITIVDKNNLELIKANYLTRTGELVWSNYYWYNSSLEKIKSLLITKNIYAGALESKFIQKYTEYNSEGKEIISYTINKKGEARYGMVVDKDMNILNPKKDIKTVLHDSFLDKDISLVFKRNRLRLAYFKNESGNNVFILPNYRNAKWKDYSRVVKSLNYFSEDKKIDFNNILGKEVSKTIFMKFIVDETGSVSEFELLGDRSIYSELDTLLKEHFIGKEFFKPAVVKRGAHKLKTAQLIIIPLVIRFEF